MNTIRPEQSGEPASAWRSPRHSSRETEARGEAVGVIGGSMSRKGCKVNTGDLSGQIGVHAAKQPKNRPTGVRAVIVATKSGNADGAKDGRKRKWHLKENPHEKRLSITQEVRTNAALVPRRLNRSDTARGQCCLRPVSVWSNKPKGLSLVLQTSARTKRVNP